MARTWHGPKWLGWVATLALVVGGACASGASPQGTPGATRSPVASQSSPVAQFPVTVVDDDGVSVTIASRPERLVTFAPSNTEIVFALGLGDELVGVSGSFDNYPPEARTIEQIGGSGEFGVDPNAEKVVALHPDLMLTIAGGDEWKKRLRDLGVAVFTINATDLSDLLEDILTVGRITGATEQAASLVDHMAADEGAIEDQVSSEAPVSCFFEAYYPPLTTIGPRTFIFDLLERAGCSPVSAGAKSDYPEWSVDVLVADGPDVYLVASESGVSAEAVAKRPGFSAIEAVAGGRVYLVDSDLISRPGPRVIDGLRSLAQILHPASVP
jgi:iron complex transport system substrate-binding protein